MEASLTSSPLLVTFSFEAFRFFTSLAEVRSLHRKKSVCLCVCVRERERRREIVRVCACVRDQARERGAAAADTGESEM